MTADWSKVKVDVHPDSPWLRTPPTETALQEFCPDLVFRPSEARDAAAFAAAVDQRTLFGHPANIKPIKPAVNEYLYESSELSVAPPPAFNVLIPPASHPADPLPPKNFMYPKAPTFTLKKTSMYQRGYVYTAPYSLSAKEADYHRMMRVVLPPQLYPRNVQGKYVHDAVPDCVQLVPGVPFAFEIDGREDDLHTIAGIHTFESLRFETDFWEIYKDTVLVAKGLRGCRRAGNSDEVFPISDFPIKTNDRSPSNVTDGSKEGSYNLASTRLKGIGRGVVLPAAQVDTPQFSGQVCAILRSLGRLRRRLLRKTLSKYEYEVTEFNSDDMNVVGFGGLEPNNATSCQLNMSALWQSLAKALGIQGGEHPDCNDEETRKTYLLLLFNLPPGSDPGAFLLARAGLFLRELDTWALHVFFDGTDIHAGAGGETTLSVPQFQQWVETELETAWKHSELGRMGVVQYAMRSAHNRDTHMSMTPSVRFGNAGPELGATVRDFATHGQEILGGQEPWANRMGREIVYNFWNQLQLCNLDLQIDIDTVLQSITFQNGAAEQVRLKPLPFHPIKDAEAMALKRGHFEYFRQRCTKVRIYIEKWHFLDFRRTLASNGPPDERECLLSQWPDRSSLSTKSIQNSVLPCGDFEGNVVKILDYIRIGNQCCFRVETDYTDATPKLIDQNDPRLPVTMVDQFFAVEVPKIFSAPILDSHEVFDFETAGTSIPMTETESTAITIDQSDKTGEPQTQSVGEESSNTDTAANTSQPQDQNLVSDNSGPANTSDDTEYDVEKILAVDHDHDGTWYKCKFTGVVESDEDWVHESDLSNGCQALLKKFYASLNAGSGTRSDSSSDSQSGSDSDPGPKRKKKKTTKAQDKPGPITAVSLEHKEHLAALLNVDRLSLEIAEVKADRPTQGRASRMFFGAMASPMLVANIVDTCSAQSKQLAMLEMIIDNQRSSNLAIASAEFTKLASSAGVISQVTAYEKVTSFLTRILRWTGARAHIVVYRWCASVGPTTIKNLFEVHRASGFSGFQSNRPLGLVVDHIVQHVCEAMRTHPDKHHNSTPLHGPFGPIVTGDITRIPGDLYGLLDMGGKHNIPPITLAAPGRLNLYAACQVCLLDVFQKAVIMPALRGCNDVSAPTNTRSRVNYDSIVFSRAICRGAVLECILEVCRDDGILSSQALETVIHSPWLSFTLSRADRLGPALLNRAELTLAPLKAWLSKCLENTPQIQMFAKQLGDEMHSVLLEMAAGEPHPDTIESIQDAARQKPTRAIPKARPKKTRIVSYNPPPLDAIVPVGVTPKFALVALVIREALNLKRNLGAGNPHLRRLLLGQHATLSMAGERNRDHVDPCREFNIYTALFQAHFSGVQLTSPQGLSNTISWFGTGQGAGTEKFLNSLLPDGGFFKVDAAGMVGQFQSGIDRLGMSDMPVENQKAWGNQPNPALAAQPTKKTEGKRSQKQPPYKGKHKRNASNSTPKEQYTLQEKFAPYFAEVVQGAWSQHLGGVAGKDPATVPPAELPRWSSTIKLLAELEIPAFKTGLTAMQLVNTLAFSKVVQLPTVTEMAEWISDNPKLGAVTGLSLLGFRTGTRDQIQASYICFHHILEKFLTRADQEGVGFHPPFTEHVLCKTPRWDKYLARDKSATLVEIAAQLQGVPWISGQNINDATALPLPSVVSRDDLQSALSSEGGSEPGQELEGELTQDLFDIEEHFSDMNVEQPEFVQGSSSTGRVIVESMSTLP